MALHAFAVQIQQCLVEKADVGLELLRVVEVLHLECSSLS